MEDVNQNISIKQYIFIPLLAISTILISAFLLNNSSDVYENEDIKFKLNNSWSMVAAPNSDDVVFIAKDNTATVLTIKKLVPYVFGVEAGHSTYNSVLYQDYQNNKTEELSIQENKATCFNFNYQDYSNDKPVSMVSRELVVSVDEKLYAIGVHCEETESEKYLSNFDQLISSLDIKK